ncbi:MAG: hypothetical protein KAI94_06520 [Anaerolineales bacterium]|nr:hypothetical protein [Anaerolineales bacterium]
MISLSCGVDIDVTTGSSSLEGGGEVVEGIIFAHPERPAKMMSKKVIEMQLVNFKIKDDTYSNVLLNKGKTRRRIMPSPHVGLFGGGFLCWGSWRLENDVWNLDLYLSLNIPHLLRSAQLGTMSTVDQGFGSFDVELI